MTTRRKHPRATVRLWLLTMDAIVACGGFGSRLYPWALERAARADG